MEKKLSDYLHLYLGCDCVRFDVDGKNMSEAIRLTHENLQNITNPSPLYKYLPILRPLITATGHETDNVILPLISAINSFDSEGLNDMKIKQCAELTRWLLSKHFDLFGLIEAGLAIDATVTNSLNTAEAGK